jgi:hypothetical protein
LRRFAVGDRPAGDDGLDVRVDEIGELLAVLATERDDLDLGHGRASWRNDSARQDAATGAARRRA